jgi:hypothetical protein
MIRSLKFLNQLALVALALCFAAGLGKAQNAYEGTFTLPFEARWAGTVLPAGDYTISMRSARAPYLLFVRGEGKSVMILANGAAEKQLSDDSKLILVDADGTETIANLEAGQLGLTLDYSVPKSNIKHMAGSAGGAKPAHSEVIVPVRGAYGSASGR